ncbi:ABC transporter ATP-binding protein [Bradyrhizobium sp. WSM1417]|uniref:ABC transporter ATP-binding protein n=1 Tax=Bradyrhizobium sp. WSM1417 TaxID=754500 RepID=UPI0004AD1FD3|nr:ABC transporter ATP-binding protein [Bradyrhizobium sp. WSM1417]
MSIRAQVLHLLMDIQEKFGLTYLLIAHDLALVEHLSPRVAVLYLGGVVEYGQSEQIFTAPKHPYTQALLDAGPRLDPDYTPKAADSFAIRARTAQRLRVSPALSTCDGGLQVGESGTRETRWRREAACIRSVIRQRLKSEQPERACELTN